MNVDVKGKRGHNKIPQETDWSPIEKRVINTEEVLNINGRDVKIINAGREIWKGISKAELLTYYHNAWKYLKPYLKDRPLGLHINPYGATAPDYWIRNMKGHQPEWVEFFRTERKHNKEVKGEFIDWIICNNEETLFYILDLESIDLHPWTSRRTSPGFPDFIVIDLDPSDGDFSKAVETAAAAKEFFDYNGIISFIKTSGKSGLHLLIPCTEIEFGSSRIIAEHICSEINRLIPSITTTERAVEERGNKLYIDPNQNDYGDRIAAPYCLRAYNKPLVSAPLKWNEVKSGLNPEDFNINSMKKRLTKTGDIFKGLLLQKNRRHNMGILRKYI